MTTSNLGTITVPTSEKKSIGREKSNQLLNRYAEKISQVIEEEVSPRRAMLITAAIGALMTAVVCAVLLQFTLFILSMGVFATMAAKAGMFPEMQKGGKR